MFLIYSSVSTSVNTKEEATILCNGVLQKKLGFCCHIAGPTQSLYTWENKLEIQEEWTCHIKTSLEKKKDVADYILKHHPYDVPEIGSTDIESLNPAYTKWALDYLGIHS